MTHFGISPEPASDDAARKGKSDGITTFAQFESPAEKPDANSLGNKKRTVKAAMPDKKMKVLFFNNIHLLKTMLSVLFLTLPFHKLLKEE